MVGIRREAAPTWRKGAVVLFIGSVLLSCGGCARPGNNNLTAFAGSTAALATLAKNEHDLNVEIDAKNKLAKAAAYYAEGDSKSKIEFPAKGGKFMTGHSDKDWEAVQAFLDSVSKYADALSKASNSKLESDLTGQLSSLNTSLTKAATARDVAIGNKLATSRQKYLQNIGGAVVDIVGVASNIYAGFKIHSAMVKVQPALDNARAPLKTALHAVLVETKNKRDAYRVAIRKELKADAKDAFLTKYNDYIALDKDYESIQTRIAALSGVDKAVDAMIDAHAKLKDNLDSKTAMLQFLNDVSHITDKVTQAEALRKQL